MPATMAETWASRWQAAARRGNNPFEGLPFADVEAAMAKVLPVFDGGDQHGSPKYARFYDGIHMGMTADGTQSHIVPVIVEWMRARLGL